MVIDISAIAAVLLNEASAPRITQAIEAGTPRQLSAANLLEISIVIESRKGEAGRRELGSPRTQSAAGYLLGTPRDRLDALEGRNHVEQHHLIGSAGSNQSQQPHMVLRSRLVNLFRGLKT